VFEKPRIANISAGPGRHGLGAGARSFSSRDLPIPIQRASSCGISLHIGIPPFFLRTVDRLS